VLVGFEPDGLASVAFAVAAALHEVVPLAAVAVVRVEPLLGGPADLAHVASAAVGADDFHVAPVGSAPEPVHDAFVVAAAAAGQLRVVVAAAVAVVQVLRLSRLAAVVVAPVGLHVQLAPHLLHVPLDAVHSADGVAPVRRAADRVAPWPPHAAIEPVEPAAEEQLVVFAVVTKFVPFVAPPVHVARLSPGTSVPSHDREQYSRVDP
jgi:hypothetical protein